MNMKDTSEIFGENVFSLSVMKARLPKETFKEVKAAIDNGKRLSDEAASVVANEMKQWAIEKGATHYTHWFQPMTGYTSEKHDSFVLVRTFTPEQMQLAGRMSRRAVRGFSKRRSAAADDVA